jgi:hypothetical protein
MSRRPEGLPIALAEGWRAAGLQAAAAHGVHEIAHVQPLADVFACVQLTARIQSQAAFFDDFCSQGNIGGDDEVAFARVPDNVAIGNIEAAGHLNRADMARARHGQRLVSHQRELHLRAIGGTVEDLLDYARAGVGVYPKLGLGHGRNGRVDRRPL